MSSFSVLAFVACLAVASASPVVNTDFNTVLWDGDNALERRELVETTALYGCASLSNKECKQDDTCTFVKEENDNGKMIKACIDKDYTCSDLDRQVCKLPSFEGECKWSGKGKKGSCKDVDADVDACDGLNKKKCKKITIKSEGATTCAYVDDMCEAITIEQCSDVLDRKTCKEAYDLENLDLPVECEWSGGACQDIVAKTCEDFSGKKSHCLKQAIKKEGLICDWNGDSCESAECADFDGNKRQCKRLVELGPDAPLCKWNKNNKMCNEVTA